MLSPHAVAIGHPPWEAPAATLDTLPQLVVPMFRPDVAPAATPAAAPPASPAASLQPHPVTASPVELPRSFTGQIPPETKPGSELHVSVPPGNFLAGATLRYLVPENVPADGMVEIPIRLENVVSGTS